MCAQGEKAMRILVLPCDGIGPEITAATMQVLETADRLFGLGLNFDYEDAGFTSLEKYGTTLRDETLAGPAAMTASSSGPSPTWTIRPATRAA